MRCKASRNNASKKQTMWSQCCDAATKDTCHFRTPSLDWFQGNGIFSHIRLPIQEDVPKDVLKYITCHHYTIDRQRNQILQDNVKNMLNSLF